MVQGESYAWARDPRNITKNLTKHRAAACHRLSLESHWLQTARFGEQFVATNVENTPQDILSVLKVSLSSPILSYAHMFLVLHTVSLC